MNEAVKTGIYVGVALLVALIAIVSYPRQEPFRAPEMVGEFLFSDFKDPASAANLEIVSFNEELGQLRSFEVDKDRQTGIWTIPSSQGYPADAEDQMRDAAVALVDLEVIGIATEVPGEHETFGVIEPDRDELDASQSGVGLLVTVKDIRGRNLASLIIGKKVQGSDTQRFVRVPGQNPVYVVDIDPEGFSTDFEDWIEKDLLQLNTFEIVSITLKDYTVVTGRTRTGQTVVTSFDQRFEATVEWDTAAAQWNLAEMIEYRDQEPVPTELLDSEELDTERLNEMKNAFGDVQIVDVRRKPSGLSSDLTASQDFMRDDDSRASLIERGFFPLSIAGGPPELRAANGEVHVTLSNGVQYVLRFGEIAGLGEEEDSGVNRYMFVTARVDESAFPPLELEPLPEASGPDEPPPPPGAGDPEGDSSSDGDTSDGSSSDESGSDGSGSDETNEAEGGDGCGQEDGQPPAAGDQETGDQETGDQETGDQETGAQETGTEETGEDEAGEGEAGEGEAGDEPPGEQDDTAATLLEAERERIRQENQRRIDERNAELEAAQRRVDELNSRFGPWYYVISDEVYKKIHLDRSDLIQEAESAPDEGFGVEAFRRLEEQGLEGPAAPAAPEFPGFPPG